MPLVLMPFVRVSKHLTRSYVCIIFCVPQYRQLEGTGSEAQQAGVAEAYARTWHDSFVDDLFGGMLQSTIKCQVRGGGLHRAMCAA